MTNIQIVGFASTWKVPGYYAETVYGAGAISASSIPLKLLYFGNKTSAGSATPDSDFVPILSVTDADALLGAGSEIATMCYAGLQEAGVAITAAPNVESGGAKATATITITGTATAAGTASYRVDGTLVTAAVLANDAQNTIATNIAAAFNANTRLPVTAAAVANAVTLTRNNKGPRGNDGTLFQTTNVPATGVTSAIAGGASMTGGGVHFTGGTTLDSLTNVLAIEFPGQWDRIAAAQNDATNAAALSAQLTTKAGVLEGRLEHAILATTASLSSATTLAQTTLNAQRMQLLWALNAESHPSQIAARFAARRTSVEQGDPDAAYDDFVLTGIVPSAQPADVPSLATQQSALNAGVTPVKPLNGQALIVRSITTHCLNGSNPDYRTLDTSDAYVPDYVRVVLGLVWSTEFKPANPRVSDDPPGSTTKELPPGLATPKRWTERATLALKDLEGASPPILIQVDQNPVTSAFDATARRIMSIVPCVPAPNNHQIGVSVRQLNAA